jgi:hypothetical protein
MSISRILGIISVIVGLVLLAFAWSSSHAVTEKVAAATTGRFTQTTIWYIIIGLIMVIGGGCLWIGGRPKP